MRACEQAPELPVIWLTEIASTASRERVLRLIFLQMTMLFAAVYKGREIVVSSVS